MDTNKAGPRELEYLLQAIDAEIKLLEESTRESLRALRRRRNALAPISSLPTEIIIAIFSLLQALLRLPRIPQLGEKPDHLAWLRVAHVCQQWREITLNLPHFWSHIDFTNLTSTGEAEILARAKEAPLYLEARLPDSHRKYAWFGAFEKELQTHISYTCHLTISAEPFRLRRTLEGLVSPAPMLEYLSLSYPSEPWSSLRTFVPDALFNGTAPRLSCLRLCNCDISWKSPLLKGLKILDIRTPSPNARPIIGVWLDALNEMPKLLSLVLHLTSPSAPHLQFDVERTVTLPSLTHFNISDYALECALALAHLVLPALTWLFVAATSYISNGRDTQSVLQYTAQHAHGPHDTRPLQSVFIRGENTRADILAWTGVPVTDVKMDDLHASPSAMRAARVVLSFTNVGSVYQTIDAAMAVLPFDSLLVLTTYHRTRLDKRLWLCHAQRWPLLKRVRLALASARGFRETILKDNSGQERQLFSSLTRLDLIGVSLSARRTFRLYNALMKRMEQGVPLETLDLRTCFVTTDAVRVLREIVVDVWGPAEPFEIKGGRVCGWDSVARGLFIHDYDNSGEDDHAEDDGEDRSCTI